MLKSAERRYAFATTPLGTSTVPAKRTTYPTIQRPDIAAGRRSTPDSEPRPTALSWDNIKRVIPYIELLVAYQGDFGRVSEDILQLAGTSHRIMLLSPREDHVRKAQAILNQWARQIRPVLGGLPGVINDLFMQLIITGAVSQEWSLLYDDKTKRKGRVAAIHRVDVPTLELKEKPYEYHVYQVQSDGAKKRLLYPTYQLQVMRPLGNLPYPIPPFLSALEDHKRLTNALASIDKAIKKLGLLGLIALEVKKPVRMFFETELSYQSRLEGYLATVHDTLMNGMNEGIVTHYDSLQSPKVLNFAGDINNSYAFLKMLELRLNKGLGDWLADEKTRGQTYIKVLYDKMLSKLVHSERLVATILEVGQLLHLLFRGLIIYDVRFSFVRDTERFWEKKVIEQKFFIELVKTFGYDPERALKHMGFGTGEEDITFPLDVQDVLRQNYYRAHLRHTEILYASVLEFDHFANPLTVPELYRQRAFHAIRLSEL